MCFSTGFVPGSHCDSEKKTIVFNYYLQPPRAVITKLLSSHINANINNIRSHIFAGTKKFN